MSDVVLVEAVVIWHCMISAVRLYKQRYWHEL